MQAFGGVCLGAEVQGSGPACGDFLRVFPLSRLAVLSNEGGKVQKIILKKKECTSHRNRKYLGESLVKK